MTVSLCLLVIRHLIHRGIADIVDGIAVFLFKEIDFKRKNGEDFIYITLDGFDAPFLPCPQLRRDVIIDGADADGMDIFCNFKVEARVIDKDDHIGLPRHDILLALLQPPQDGTCVQDNGHNTHESEVAIMTHQMHTLRLHEVTAEATEFCIRVLGFERSDEMGSVDIATRLTGNEVVFHL